MLRVDMQLADVFILGVAYYSHAEHHVKDLGPKNGSLK